MMKRLRTYYKVPLLCLISLCLAYAFLFDRYDENAIATLCLENGDEPDVVIQVPAKYVGPDMLALSRRAKKGDTVNFVPFSFTYPEMQPWPKNWPELEKAGYEGLVYATLSAGKRGGLRNYIKSETDPDVKTSRWGVPKGTEYGMQAFFSIWGEDWAYYHEAKEGDAVGDVFIMCPPKSFRDKCRYLIEVTDTLTIEFSSPQKTVPQWNEVVTKIKTFVSSVVRKQ